MGAEKTKAIHCGRCGSPISYETKDELALYACSPDDPTQVRPTYHALTAEQLPGSR